MGIDFDRVINKTQVDEETHCSICKLILENPCIIITCEHIFCNDCLKRWLQENSVCPLDRQDVEPKHLSLRAPRILRNLLDRLQFTCEFKDKGCKLIIQHTELDLHTKKCEFNPNKDTVELEEESGEKINLHSSIEQATGANQEMASNNQDEPNISITPRYAPISTREHSIFSSYLPNFSDITSMLLSLSQDLPQSSGRNERESSPVRPPLHELNARWEASGIEPDVINSPSHSPARGRKSRLRLRQNLFRQMMDPNCEDIQPTPLDDDPFYELHTWRASNIDLGAGINVCPPCTPVRGNSPTNAEFQDAEDDSSTDNLLATEETTVPFIDTTISDNFNTERNSSEREVD